MAVQPQTPYIEHIANGTTTGFNLGFGCDDQDHLIVLVNDVEPVFGSWSLTGGAVVFGAAPTSGNKITIQRNTPFERKRDYQSYDNSFRPPTVNKDFDWIWLKLQELGVADWILGNRLDALKGYVDKKDDQLQENIDNLKGYVDLKDDELRAYLMEEIRKQGVALDQLDDYYNYLMQRLAQIAVDKGWDASFVVDGDKTQQEINTNQNTINNANVVMIDLFASVAAALDWVKSNVNNYLYVKAGTTYTLPTGNVYFNRVICLDGKASFIVPATTNLSYINFTDGSEVLYLKNIRYLIAGHRGTLTASTSLVYTSVNTLKTANLENLEIYGLTDINNIDSWRDDVGMTRVQGFINYRVSESSRINNVNFYGVAGFAMVDTVSSGAIHSEENVTGYNAETGIYFPVNVWRSGTSKNINIFNNDLQKGYWINRDRAVSPIGRNGKNCIMCEADHNISYVIDGANMVYGIEKSVYCTSTNSVVRNTSDDKCFSMTTIKSPKDAGSPKSAIDGFNLICRNPTNGNGVQDTYGWLKGVLERVRIENDAKNITKPFIFSDLGHLTCKNLFAKNTGIPLYFGDGNNISKLEVIDSEFIDCYDANLASLYFKAAGTKTISELALDNVRHYCADIDSISAANIPTVGIALDGVVKFKFNNSRSFAKVYPFSKAAATTYIEVLNSKFILKNSDLIANMWGSLKAGTTFQANMFDFTADFLTTNATVPNLKVDARFKKINDSGMVNCADYWSDINIGYPVTVANGISLMTVGDKSFELIASFNDKLLKFYWDSVAKTIIPVANLGSLFATTLTSDKINVYVNAANNQLVINIGNGAWSGGVGNLSVKISRF